MIRLAHDLKIPPQFVTETCAILARRGAGKTYAALKIAEELAHERLPFVVIDPTGVCWGLRSSADGNGSGFPIVILGGEHSDLPLASTSGKVVADFVVESGASIILDLSLFESRADQDRFVFAFAERLYRAKAKQRHPLHLIVDEADQFAPQRPQPDQTRMLGAWESIVRLGRSRGLGITMITQRPAVLNKNVLTQIEILIVMQITAPQDRAAIKAWIDGNADAEEAKVVLGSLAGLQRGEAWVWSPGWLKILQRIKVAARVTFDSSATPDASGAVLQPRKTAKVDLKGLSEAMAATIEHAEANDPVALKRTIADLRRQLKDVPERVVEVEVVREVLVVPPVIRKIAEAAGVMVAELGVMADRMAVVAHEADDALKVSPNGDTVSRGTTPVPTRVRRARVTPLDASGAPSGPSVPVVSATLGDPALKKGARRMLDTVVRNHPVHYSRSQIGGLTGIKPSGGTFGAYFGALKRAGLIIEVNGLIEPTPAGFEVSGVEPAAPTTTAEVLEVWRSSLKAGARRMLDEVIAAPGHTITREKLAAATGIEAGGGTFGAYLGTLRRNGLIEVEGDQVTASEALML